MNTARRIAILVGVLYITGTVAGILSVVATSGVMDAQDYLTRISANENRVVTGALLVLIMGLSLAFIPAAMYPILGTKHETLAIGYIIFRGALETFTYIGMAVSWLVLIAVSREYLKATPQDAASMQTLGTLVLSGHDSISSMLEVVFPLGALMFYTALYQADLIPRWLSGWGLAAATISLATGLAGLSGVFDLNTVTSTANLLLSFPIFLQEMVMAVWLIVKGFSPETQTSTAPTIPADRLKPGFAPTTP